MRTIARLLAAACLAVSVQTAFGYATRKSLDLEKMSEEADVIFKGIVLASEPAEECNAWFQNVEGFNVQETRFRVVSTIKGALDAEVAFQHYMHDPEKWAIYFHPQRYKFEKDRAYIVFAKKAAPDDNKNLRQIWLLHSNKDDQGVLLCAEAEPLSRPDLPFKTTVTLTEEPEKLGYAVRNAQTGNTVRATSGGQAVSSQLVGRQAELTKALKEIFWQELVKMLASADPKDVQYGETQLDDMSGSISNRFIGINGSQDFDRKETLTALLPRVRKSEPEIAARTLKIIGSHNANFEVMPLRSATVNDWPGWARGNRNRPNPGADWFHKELAEIASEGDLPPETRAAAIYALGLSKKPDLKEPLQSWLADPQAAIRAAAVVLLIDFPGAETQATWKRLSTDPDPQVRRNVARAIGIAQAQELVPILDALAQDEDKSVSKSATDAAKIMDWDRSNVDVAWRPSL